mgnify:CR=1 FL=1
MAGRMFDWVQWFRSEFAPDGVRVDAAADIELVSHGSSPTAPARPPVRQGVAAGASFAQGRRRFSCRHP